MIRIRSIHSKLAHGMTLVDQNNQKEPSSGIFVSGVVIVVNVAGILS